MYFVLKVFILSILFPTSRGLTCLSSPTIITFLAIYRRINELKSDWLASSTIIISNLFSAGFRVSITLFIGIIQAGTAFWQVAIFSLACFLYRGAFFPVPFPIFCIVCSQPLSAWLTNRFSFFSIKCNTWYQDFFSTNSKVAFLIFLTFSKAFFSSFS